MGDHIFISYAHADSSEFAEETHNALETKSYNMWLDALDIPKGANWPLTIQQAILSCRALVFIISPESIKSKVCMNELTQAHISDLPIIPLNYIDVGKANLPFLINNINYIDCTDKTQAFGDLAAALAKLPPAEARDPNEIIVPEFAARSGALTANLYTDADEVRELSETGLIGRDALRSEIMAYLKNDNARLLLQAFGGTGKTALAAHTAYDWLKQNGGEVLWLRLGASNTETTFEALAHPFGASQAMASAQGDAKATLLLQLLKSRPIKLIVLDDVWNGLSLQAIQAALPRSIPLLVTARQRYPLRKIIQVPQLEPPDSLKLLRELAPDLANDDAAALGLCDDLKHLAFAIEIAGRTMQVKNYSAATLRQQIAQTDITKMEVPLEYRVQGRESIAALIQTTLDVLPEAAKNAFLAWGAFWSPTITPELMMTYFVGKPEISSDMIANARAGVPEIAEWTDEQVRIAMEQSISQNINPQAAEDALNLLLQYGLASREEAKQYEDGRPQTIAFYRLHDLAFTYTTSQSSEENHHKSLDACLSYTERYNKPSPKNFAALVPELDNFMGAASFAKQQERYTDVEQFAWNLYAGSQLMRYLGYNQQGIQILQQATHAAEKSGNRYSQGAHLTNLGLAYENLGEYEKAIDYQQQALAIKREMGDKRGEGNSLGNLGNVYYFLGQYEQAIVYHQQALAIKREMGSKQSEGISLSNLGNSYGRLGQYEQAVDYYQQALAISREMGDKDGEGQDLGNLGNSYGRLGQYKQAIDYEEQSLAIKREMGNKQGEGSSLGRLGAYYNALGQHEQGIEYLQKALSISREIGDRLNEGYWLNLLGATYEDLKDYPKAIAYYEQSLALRKQLGNPHLIAETERNLARAREKMAKGE
jgi:tetratricopeptide (TPR) repeat protein